MPVFGRNGDGFDACNIKIEGSSPISMVFESTQFLLSCDLQYECGKTSRRHTQECKKVQCCGEGSRSLSTFPHFCVAM